jgi:hypothetical protein
MVRTGGEVMNTFTLSALNIFDVTLLLSSLIDTDCNLREAIENERLCTNNEDTIHVLQMDRKRIEYITYELKRQLEQQ